MNTRKIVQIDEEICNGCGLCIPNCAEGAIKIVDGKAKLISDEFCDGLGACLGNCPRNAITIVEREAEDFNEKAVKKHLSNQDEEGHDVHQDEIPCGCPGSFIRDMRDERSSKITIESKNNESELKQWPIQLKLVSVNAPYFNDADLLVCADCVPFAYANFHQEFLRGKAIAMGCPKLDDAQYYSEKLTELIRSNNIKSITLLNMEVPCCFGLQHVIETAVRNSGKVVPIKQTIITIKGQKQQPLEAKAQL